MKREFIRKIAVVAMCLTVLAVFTTSCRDDDDEPVEHTLKFEIKGTYTGNLKATLTYGSETSLDGGIEDVPKLPWSKEVKVKGAYAMGIGVMTWDKSGKKGETAVIKMYVDGKEVKSSTATADNDGDIMSNTMQYSGGN